MRESVTDLYRAFVPARSPSAQAPFLLLNSLATTTQIWDSLVAELSQSRPLVLVDYHGHGRSPGRDCPRDLDQLATQLVAVLDAADIAAVHVAGVSIGGMASLRLAALYPERILSAAVIASTPLMEDAMWRRRRDLVTAWGTAGIAEEVLQRWFTEQYRAANPHTVLTYQQMLERTTDNAYVSFCDVLRAVDMRPGLHDVACPVAVVSGSEDLAATVEQGAMIADGVKRGHQHVIPGAAHMVQAMAPTQLAHIMTEHVAGLP